MKHRYRFVLISLIIVALICLTAYLAFGRNSNPAIGPSSQPTTTVTDPAVSTVATSSTAETGAATESTAPIQTIPPSEPNEHLTIVQVQMDPSAVIDRDPEISPADPEYIPGLESLINAEGKVCQNDRILTYRFFDEYSGDWLSISFGRADGTYNRFLYLDPAFTVNDQQTSCWLHFLTPSDGSIITVTNSPPTAGHSITFSRYRDDGKDAAYSDMQRPGTVWCPGEGFSDPAHIDLLLYRGTRICMVLQLTIEKTDAGTYCLSDIRDKNLTSDLSKDPTFSLSELEHIAELFTTAFNDPMQCGRFWDPMTTPSLDQFIFDIRHDDPGLYYQQFDPAVGIDETYTSAILAQSESPVIAVTYKYYSSTISLTFYFEILEDPSPEKHGVYHFIGMDYPSITNLTAMISNGWDGESS